MTNLIASAMTLVSLYTSYQTNTVESSMPPAPSDGHNWIYNYNQNVLYNPSFPQPVPPAQEKWATTTITRADVFEFQFNGQLDDFTNVVNISTNTVHLREKQDWEVVK